MTYLSPVLQRASQRLEYYLLRPLCSGRGRGLAYTKLVLLAANGQGGVASRKINFISLDDGGSPPQTLEQVRRLIEEG